MTFCWFYSINETVHVDVVCLCGSLVQYGNFSFIVSELVQVNLDNSSSLLSSSSY